MLNQIFNEQLKLALISIYNYQQNFTIKSGAFQHLNQLNTIQFNGMTIKWIGKESFKFINQSKGGLSIGFVNSQPIDGE